MKPSEPDTVNSAVELTPAPAKPAVTQLLKAVFGAMIGVQSEQQRQQDFRSQSIVPYLITGIVVTLLFVALLLTIVSLVVP